jgi:hypothetical protein
MGKTDGMQGSLDLLVLKTLRREGRLHGLCPRFARGRATCCA